MQIKKKEVYERILAVSEKLFIRYGYAKTSLNLIADKCYISKSNIYRYFSSKEEIYETLVKEARHSILEIADRMTASDFIKKNLNMKVSEISHRLADVVAEHRNGILVMLNSGRNEDRDFITSRYIRIFTERSQVPDNDLNKLIAKIQIFALTDVITSYEDPAELKKHILLLMKYHYVGINGLLPKEKR